VSEVDGKRHPMAAQPFCALHHSPPPPRWKHKPAARSLVQLKRAVQSIACCTAVLSTGAP